ncbi:hypothetical protein PIB30_106284, partial [Stylosanthes scabra]|nr:hypothetical protein [Stylosanthes scabra]
MARKDFLIFEQKNSLPGVILEKAQKLHEETTYATTHQCTTRPPPPGSQSPNFFIPPQFGTYKLNIDATMINGRRGGVGVVVRDSEGAVMAAATLE